MNANHDHDKWPELQNQSWQTAWVEITTVSNSGWLGWWPLQDKGQLWCSLLRTVGIMPSQETNSPMNLLWLPDEKNEVVAVWCANLYTKENLLDNTHKNYALILLMTYNGLWLSWISTQQSTKYFLLSDLKSMVALGFPKSAFLFFLAIKAVSKHNLMTSPITTFATMLLLVLANDYCLASMKIKY